MPFAPARPSRFSITFAVFRNTGVGLRQAPMLELRVTDPQPSGQQIVKVACEPMQSARFGFDAIRGTA